MEHQPAKSGAGSSSFSMRRTAASAPGVIRWKAPSKAATTDHNAEGFAGHQSR
jgi:hypothetical protein